MLSAAHDGVLDYGSISRIEPDTLVKEALLLREHDHSLRAQLAMVRIMAMIPRYSESSFKEAKGLLDVVVDAKMPWLKVTGFDVETYYREQLKKRRKKNG